MNELIREYLKYNGYRSSLSVFSAGKYVAHVNITVEQLMGAESMLPKDPMDKESLVEELGVDATTYPSNMYVSVFKMIHLNRCTKLSLARFFMD